MSIRTDLERLQNGIEMFDAEFSGTEWYLFGSTIHEREVPGDIDVLIVYPSDYNSLDLRCRLEGLLLRAPYHLLLVTREEESELGFIGAEKCERIFPTKDPWLKESGW